MYLSAKGWDDELAKISEGDSSKSHREEEVQLTCVEEFQPNYAVFIRETTKKCLHAPPDQRIEPRKRVGRA